MRIIIQDYEPKSEIEYDKHYTKPIFYTDDGIYHYYSSSNKLCKQNIVHNHYDVFPYRHYEFLVDYTTFQDGDILYHIPYKHRYCEEHYSVKELGQGLTFVKKYSFDQHSFYFEFNGKLESFVFPKMFTFLM
jgi:hypothetical protein